MATVTSLTKDRMLAIEAASVVGGTVNVDGNLILTRHDGSTINAGDVKRLLPPRLSTANNLGAGNNPDTLTETGFYSGYNWIGSLSAYSIGTLVVNQYSPDWITQTFTTVEAVPKTLIRSRFNGTTWGVWVLVITKGLLDDSKATFSGIVDGSWAGVGTFCPVVLDAGQVDSGTKNAKYDLNDLAIQPGVTVVVSRIGGPSGTWWVEKAYPAFSAFMRQIPINLMNNWQLYSDYAEIAENYGTSRYATSSPALMGYSDNKFNYTGKVYATMSRYGVVRVEGLIQCGVSSFVSQPFATLPIGMRPSYEQSFAVNTSAGTAQIIVKPDGTITSNLTSAVAYLSLANICFRSKSAIDLGLVSFTSLLPFITGFSAYTGTYYAGGPSSHPPGYTKDPDGVVLFEGAIQATSAHVANTVFGRLTSLGFNYGKAAHMTCYQPGLIIGIFRFGTNAASSLPGTQGMNIGNNMPVGKYAILSGLSLIDPTSLTTPTVTLVGQNSWKNHNAGEWRAPSMSVTPDKQIFLGGLWDGGAVNTPMTVLASGNRSRYYQIFNTLAGDNSARVDVLPVGTPTLSSGSTAWVTLDSISYSAYK